MSANASGTVWKKARAKGGSLLTLLAIADVADEQGRNAWPSPEHLAAKTRMTPRAMRLILHALEREGEIVIQPNVERRVVRSGYVPPFFLHIRCVFDEAGYEQGKQEKISETAFVSGRRPTGKDFPKLTRGNRKSLPPKRKNRVSQSEKSRTAYKEDPSVDPLVELKAGAQTPPPSATADENPIDNVAVITKLIHQILDHFSPDQSDLPELVKASCASYDIAYNSEAVVRAIESADYQRVRAGKRPSDPNSSGATKARLEMAS